MSLLTGLVSYYSLNEGAGTIAGDDQRRGNDLTLTSSPAWSNGPVGGALSFDGTNRYAANFSCTSQIPFYPHPFSMSAWVYCNSAPTSLTIFYAIGAIPADYTSVAGLIAFGEEVETTSIFGGTGTTPQRPVLSTLERGN